MIQTIECPCGQIFAACREPECYEEKDWKNDIVNYENRGCKINISQTVKWGKCTCKNMDKRNKIEPTVSDPVFIDENQLSLF